MHENRSLLMLMRIVHIDLLSEAIHRGQETTLRKISRPYLIVHRMSCLLASVDGPKFTSISLDGLTRMVALSRH